MSMLGNSAIAGMPNACTAAASASSRSMLRRSIPGIEATGSRCCVPSTTNMG